MNELDNIIDNLALTISGNTSDPIWFSNIDLKYAYSQMALSGELVDKVISAK